MDSLFGTYGFAPENGRSLVSSGAIYDDSEHVGFTQFQLYTVTENGFVNSIEYVKETYRNPPEYNLPFGAQCAMVSNNVLAKANVNGFHYVDMKPESFIKDIIDTIRINTYTQL